MPNMSLFSQLEHLVKEKPSHFHSLTVLNELVVIANPLVLYELYICPNSFLLNSKQKVPLIQVTKLIL